MTLALPVLLGLLAAEMQRWHSNAGQVCWNNVLERGLHDSHRSAAKLARLDRWPPTEQGDMAMSFFCNATRLATGVLLSLFLACEGQPMGATIDADSQAQRRAAERIKPLHQKKSKPAPGDWLAQHREKGQTFDQYRKAKPMRPNTVRTTVYIQPIGDFDDTQQRLVRETVKLTSRFYGLPTKLLDPLSLEIIPKEARRVHPSWGDHQILSIYVLDHVLKPRRPKDAAAMLALTTSDLWPGEGWNFVFGQASLKERVGVWSLYRYGTTKGSKAEYNQFRRRMYKVALHETGHMFGIHHCTAYECMMNGSNHLAEMDGRPMWFCPECAQKVWWGCDVEPVDRYRSLAEFADMHELDGEREYWLNCLKLLAP